MSMYRTDYETVAAGQSDQVIGPTGATGDLLKSIVIVPAVVACGAVTVKDGTTAIFSFVGGGTTALSDAKPFEIRFGEGIRSVSGSFKITTGANVSVIAAGSFT